MVSPASTSNGYRDYTDPQPNLTLSRAVHGLLASTSLQVPAMTYRQGNKPDRGRS